MEKKGGLAILVASKKPEESEKDEGGSDMEKAAESVAKELFDAVKADDKDTFVKAFKNYCAMMSEE
ncbi:MAG: hypothetical protein E6Q97_10095 [Desulfurellales bacterium]|nr:MAG: hypothetical protein E6Q97_10095 [Desulfurellales bacterium]